MLKLKKKGNAAAVSAQGKSRSIVAYFAPPMLLMLVLFLGLALVVHWLVTQDVKKQLDDSIRATAGSVGSQVSSMVETRRAAVEVLAHDSRVAEVLVTDQPDQLKALERALEKRLPGALRLQLVADNQGEDVLLGDLSGSYAAKDLYLRAVKSGSTQDAEALLDEKGQAYFILVVPVKQADKVRGALLASFPMTQINKSVSSINMEHGALGVEQVSAGSPFLLAKSSGFVGGDFVQKLPIEGTIWQVRYGATPGGGALLITVLGLAGITALIVLALFWQQKNKLAKDIKTDMGMVLSLIDSTLKRKGTPSYKPNIAESKEAIELLTKYAQATYAAGKASKADKNVAGMPQKAEEIVQAEEAETGTKGALDPANIPASIFKAGGVHGPVGDVLTPDLAQRIGQAIGTLVLKSGDKSVFIGRDMLLSSSAFEDAITAGILSAGCDVVDLGETPTPLISFATHVLSSSSSVVVSGSYSPPNYNGFEITIGGEALTSQALEELHQLVISGDFSFGAGTLSTKNISAEYIRNITTDVQVAESRKVVVDGGNGVAGPIAVRLLQALGCDVVELFCEPDGNFPNHQPDPAQPENLSSLILEVQAQDADLGIALGGDGTRIAVVDGQGRQVSTDLLLMLLAGDIIRRHPGADVIYGVGCTNSLAEYLLSIGGRPIMWKSGHAEMKMKMRETGALLAGEYSGHLYINERWFAFDDAIYTAARLLEILGSDPLPVADYFDELPRNAATPELSMSVQEGEGEALIEAMRERSNFKDADLIDIDGLRLEFAHGWALVRADHITPNLVFRFEGEDDTALQSIKDRIRELVQEVLPEARLPF